MDAPEFQRWVDIVLKALAVSPIPLAGADKRVPRHPGLYAISGLADVWLELGLGEPPDRRPLYVGKSKSDLASSVLKYHFGSEGRTGWSSPRRSFAALLLDRLALRGYPRTPEKPGNYSCFGLADDGDAKLATWMRPRLRLAMWPLIDESQYTLKDLERNVIEQLQPPVNLTHVNHEWKTPILNRRKLMADEAREAGG